jgi:hypothetical protein
MQILKIYKKMKHDMQSIKERSTKQVSKSLVNLKKTWFIHNLGSVPATDHLQVIYSHEFLEEWEVVGLHEAFDINPHLKIIWMED